MYQSSKSYTSKPFLKRISESIKLINELLASEHIFVENQPL